MGAPERSRVIRLAEAQARFPGPAGERRLWSRDVAPFDVALSFPLHPRRETPHIPDVIYFLIRGRGVLSRLTRLDPFESGEIQFVAASSELHFADTSNDLTLWRVFYGPHRGEVRP